MRSSGVLCPRTPLYAYVSFPCQTQFFANVPTLCLPHALFDPRCLKRITSTITVSTPAVLQILQQKLSVCIYLFLYPRLSLSLVLLGVVSSS